MKFSSVLGFMNNTPIAMNIKDSTGTHALTYSVCLAGEWLGQMVTLFILLGTAKLFSKQGT